MSSLKEQYENLATAYGKKFCGILDREGEWNSDFSMLVFENDAFDINEVRYVVDNHKDLVSKLAKQGTDLVTQIDEWEDYVKDCYEFNIQYINLSSWLNGAPRMSMMTRNELRKQKQELDRLIAECQEEHGTADTSGIPKQHILNPF